MKEIIMILLKNIFIFQRLKLYFTIILTILISILNINAQDKKEKSLGSQKLILIEKKRDILLEQLNKTKMFRDQLLSKYPVVGIDGTIKRIEDNGMLIWGEVRGLDESEEYIGGKRNLYVKNPPTYDGGGNSVFNLQAYYISKSLSENMYGMPVYVYMFDCNFPEKEKYVTYEVKRYSLEKQISICDSILYYGSKLLWMSEYQFIYPTQNNSLDKGLILVAKGEYKYSKKTDDIRLIGYYGYANSHGKLIYPLVLDYGNTFKEGYAKIGKLIKGEMKYGYIDTVGKLRINLSYDYADNYYSEGYTVIGKKINDKYGYGYIDKSDKEIIPTILEDAYSFSNGTARVRYGGEIINIDIHGNVISDAHGGRK